MPFNACGCEAGNELPTLSVDDGGLSIRASVPGRVLDLQGGARSGRRLTMEFVAQDILVGVIVVACVIFSAWRLMSPSMRLRTLELIAPAATRLGAERN